VGPRAGRIIYLHIFTNQSQSSSDNIGTRLRAGRPGFDFRQRQGFFPIRHRVQTGSGAHPASYQMGTEGSLPELKRPGREADHSPPN